ncbi:MAG: hypothetical protein GF355_06065 [Candidatus Eisenbacteria bacterium]|nr:hypothetical protein [Candidatus Eisenbacteria bacterium]
MVSVQGDGRGAADRVRTAEMPGGRSEIRKRDTEIRRSGERVPADSWRSPVLAVRASSMGDVIMALDAVSRLKARRPDLEVDFLTRRPFAPLARLAPAVREVLTPPSASGRSYEILWDLQGGSKGRRTARGARWKQRVDFHNQALRRRLLVWLGRRVPAPDHLLQRFLKPVLGPAPAGVSPAFLHHPAPAVTGDPPAVGLAPHARYAMKELPFKTFLDFSRALSQTGLRAVWLWDPQRPLPEELQGEPVVHGSLEDAAAAVAGCRAVVAGDTGLGHLATGLGKPVVSIFGSTVPELGYAPAGRHAVVAVDLTCRPCHVHGARHCWLGHGRCLREIGAADLMQALKSLLDPSCCQ